MGTIYFTYFTLHVVQRVHLMNALFPNMMIPTALILTLQRLSGFNVMWISATFRNFPGKGGTEITLNLKRQLKSLHFSIRDTSSFWVHVSIAMFLHQEVDVKYFTHLRHFSLYHPLSDIFLLFFGFFVGGGRSNSCKRMMNWTLWFLLLPPLNPSLNLMLSYRPNFPYTCFSISLKKQQLAFPET